MVTSGVRIGTPAVTTRGMNEAQMVLIGDFLVRVLEAPDEAKRLASIREEVADLCRQFPLYSERWAETD